MSKKSKKVAKKEKYSSSSQKDAVKALVKFLLNYETEEGLDCVSKETLQLAVDTYVELTDAGDMPGYSYSFNE